MLGTVLYLSALGYVALVILDLSRVYQNQRFREGAFVLLVCLTVATLITRRLGWHL